MLYRSSKSSTLTIKIKDLDIIHLREPTYLPDNIKLVHSKAQVARNPWNNLMEGSKFTPVNPPKALEAPKSPTPQGPVISNTPVEPTKAATNSLSPEELTTSKDTITAKTRSTPSDSQEKAMSSTPIRPGVASESPSSEDLEIAIAPVKPKAGRKATSPKISEITIGNVVMSDVTNRNKTTVESLHQAMKISNLEISGNRHVNTAKLILYALDYDLDGTNTALQTRVIELQEAKMPELKAHLAQLNAAVNDNTPVKETNKPTMIERVLKAELDQNKASGDDSGEGSSGSSPAAYGGQSTSPASGAGRGRRGSSSPTPPPSNLDLVAASKVGPSKKRRRTDDADDADDENEKPKSTKRQKMQVAGSEDVGELSSLPVQGTVDGDVPNTSTPGASDVEGVSGLSSPLATSTPKAVLPLLQAPAKSKKRKSAASIKPPGADTELKSKQQVGVVRPKPSAKGKKPQKSAAPITTGVAAEAETQEHQAGAVGSTAPAKIKEPQKPAIAFLDGGEIPFLAAGAKKSRLSDFFPPRFPKMGKPQKPAHATPDGGAAEVETKKRKRDESADGDIGSDSTQNIPEKPHKRMRLVRPKYKCPPGVLTPLRTPSPEELPKLYWVTDNEASDTEDEVGDEEPEKLEETPQLEEPIQLEESKQSEKRKQPDFFVFNGTLDTRVLFEDTIAPPQVLNATFKILTGCGNMDDVINVHKYRQGLRKYQKSHEPDHDPQKKGWRKWWAVQTYWEGKTSEIEVSASSDGQSDANNGSFDAGNAESRVQPKFDNVDDEIMYDCTEGATTGDELEAFNQRIEDRDDPIKNANKALRKSEGEWLDEISQLQSFSLDEYYTLLWKPEADPAMSKEEKLELREEEKVMMKLLGIKVASEKFREIRRSHDGRW